MGATLEEYRKIQLQALGVNTSEAKLREKIIT